MHNSTSVDDDHDDRSSEVQRLFSRQELSRVYIDDDGHIIAVFKDDTEMDVTELFDVGKQS